MARRTTPLAMSVLMMAACTARNTADGLDDRLGLQPRLTLDLPMASGDSVLVGSLRDATRFRDGRLVLADGERNRLVFVDSLGAVLGTSGRDGEGPGEFRMPGWMETCGSDSLFVLDLRTQLISVLDAEGHFARSFRPPQRGSVLMACGGDGRFATFDASGVPPVPLHPSDPPPLYRGDLVSYTSTGDTLMRVPDLPIGRIGMLGTLAAVGVVDTVAIVGISSSPELRRYGPDGTLLGVDSLPLETRQVTDSLYNAEIDRMVNSMGGDSAVRAQLRGMLSQVPKPDLAPLYQLLRVSPDGTEWVVTSLPTDPETDLLGRRRDGRFLHLTLPAQLTVYEVGTDYLLGKLADQDGEDHLMLYRWELPAP